MLLGPPDIHPHQHLGPVGGVHPARAGTDGDQRLALVVLAREQGAHLGGLDVGAQRLELGVGLGERVGLRRRLLLPRPPARRAPAGRRGAAAAPRPGAARPECGITHWSPAARGPGRPTIWDRTPRARASRCGCADRPHRAPAPPWSGWSQGRRCRLDGRVPQPTTLPAPVPGVECSGQASGMRLASSHDHVQPRCARQPLRGPARTEGRVCAHTTSPSSVPDRRGSSPRHRC